MTTTVVALPFGEGRIEVELPAETLTVVEPRRAAGVVDPADALRRALAAPIAGPPLRARLRPGATVAIAVCDGTRPQPRQLMLATLLEMFEGIIADEDVTVLIATGSHRGNTETELRGMLGNEVLGRLRVVSHDARDPAGLRWLGRMGVGVPVWLSRAWTDADVRITTGFVEPHFFAGFSGGPKLVAPGLAGLDTILCLHDVRRIGHPEARWGVTLGNPVHDDIRAVAAQTGVHFGFDVVLNTAQEVVAAFAGDLSAEHARAAATARDLTMVGVPEPFDVVVTTNAGFPLDQNLYQVVKGMSAAAQIVRPGGVIVVVAECRDGFPDHGMYRALLRSACDPTELLARIEAGPAVVADQWQVQIQARIQQRAEVLLFTTGLTAAEVVEAHLRPTDDVGEAVADALRRRGAGATLAVLPDGPQTIPYVERQVPAVA